jgi:hypothetical protein
MQTPPAPQVVPLASATQAVVLVPGWQLWHAFAGFTAPEAKMTPPMSHCVPHTPPEQICALPHEAPLASEIQVVELVPG